MQDEAPKIAGYRNFKMLGMGSISQVWLMEEEATGKKMAMNILNPNTNEFERKVFLKAVEIEMQLNHKNILRLYKLEQLGDYFILMEFCEGRSLVDDGFILKFNGKLPIDLATNIILQVLDGLIYTHNYATITFYPEKGRTTIENGIIHRNICPSNILLMRNDDGVTAKIAEFGRAKAIEVVKQNSMKDYSAQFTTDKFFKPCRQIINQMFDKQLVDVRATAASYYYMLTGKYPKKFEKDKGPFLATIYYSTIPIRQLNPAIPEKLATVIDHSLIAKPEIGVQSAVEFKKMIEDAIK